MGSSAVDNYEEAVRAGHAARAVLDDVVVLPHTAMCQLDAYVYLKASDLVRLCLLALGTVLPGAEAAAA